MQSRRVGGGVVATARKKWFKVADSLTQEPISNDHLATMIRLMGAMNQRWARDGLTAEESRTIALRPGDLMEVTGKGTLSSARATLQGAAEHVSMSVDADVSVTRITWPKWSEFQGIDSREQGSSGEKPGRKTPPPHTQTQDAYADAKRREETVPSAPPSAPKKARGKSPQVAFPGAMTEDAWRELGEQHGVDPDHLYAAARDWAAETDRRYAANGWRLAIGRALRDRWSWTAPLFGTSGPPRRRTYADDVSDQNAETFRQVVAEFDADNEEPVALFALPGGGE